VIEQLQHEADQDARRDFYQEVSAVLSLPIVPVKVDGERIVPLIEGRPGPSIIEIYWGRYGLAPDALAAIIADSKPNAVAFLEGPALDPRAPSFVSPMNGKRVSIYRSADRALTVSTDHVRLIGNVVVPGDPKAWIVRLPETFSSIPDAAEAGR